MCDSQPTITGYILGKISPFQKGHKHLSLHYSLQSSFEYYRWKGLFIIYQLLSLLLLSFISIISIVIIIII